jgi:hypothetical protein
MALTTKTKTNSPLHHKAHVFRRSLKSFFLAALVLFGLCFIVATGGGGGGGTSGTSSGTISGSAN